MFALVNVTVSNERQRARMLVGQSVEETHTLACTEKQGTRTGMYREGTVNQYVRTRTCAGKHRAERSKKRLALCCLTTRNICFVFVPVVDTSTSSFLPFSLFFMMDAH